MQKNLKDAIDTVLRAYPDLSDLQKLAETEERIAKADRQRKEAAEKTEFAQRLEESLNELEMDYHCLHQEMIDSVRHWTARGVLDYRLAHKAGRIPQSARNEIFSTAVDRAAKVFLQKADLSFEDKTDKKLGDAVFKAFFAKRNDIANDVFGKRGVLPLAFEIARTGVVVLNDHIGKVFPEEEMQAGIKYGTDAVVLYHRHGLPVANVSGLRMDKFYTPGILVL